MCTFYLSSFQRLLGPDGISPAHSSLTIDAHDCGSDNFSITTQLSQQSGDPGLLCTFKWQGVDGWWLKEAGSKSSEFDCQARSESWGCWCYWKRMGKFTPLKRTLDDRCVREREREREVERAKYRWDSCDSGFKSTSSFIVEHYLCSLLNLTLRFTNFLLPS